MVFIELYMDTRLSNSFIFFFSFEESPEDTLVLFPISKNETYVFEGPVFRLFPGIFLGVIEIIY